MTDLFRINMKQTGVMVAIMNNETEKEFPLYDNNLLREVEDMLTYINDIKEVTKIYEVADLYDRKFEESPILSEELMDKIRSGFDIPRVFDTKCLYK